MPVKLSIVKKVSSPDEANWIKLLLDDSTNQSGNCTLDHVYTGLCPSTQNLTNNQNLGITRHLFSVWIQATQGPNWRQPRLHSLAYEPDAKNTVSSDAQQEPGAQVSKHDPKTYTVLLPKSRKGKMPETLNSKSCHWGLFPLSERKLNPGWKNSKKKAAVATAWPKHVAKSTV